MKTKLLLLMLFFSFVGFCQTPSINLVNTQEINNLKINKEVVKTLENSRIKIVKERDSLQTERSKKALSVEETQKIDTLISEKDKAIKDQDLAIKLSTEDPIKKGYEKYFETRIKEKNDSILTLYTEMNNLIGKSPTDKKALESIEKKINEKKKSLKKLEFERNVKEQSFQKFEWLLPTLKPTNRESFFKSVYNNSIDKTHYVNSFALSSSRGSVSAQSEIITDNLNMLRLSFGSVVTSNSGSTTDAPASPRTTAEGDASTESETAEAALKRLIDGGGNFYLDIILPLVTTNNVNDGWITSYTYASLVGAMDIKGFGNNLDTSTGNGSFGISTYIGASSDNKKFNFFLQGNVNYTIGSDDFYKNLALKNEKGFLNGKIIAGVALLNTFKVTAIISTFGSDEAIRNGDVAIGIQVLPGL